MENLEPRNHSAPRDDKAIDLEFDHLAALFETLRLRYIATGTIDVLDQVISAITKILDSPLLDGFQRSVWLNESGNALRERYHKTKSEGDLDNALASFQEAVDYTTFRTLDRPAYLQNLGNALGDRFLAKQTIQDLHKAIIVLQESVTSTTNGFERGRRLLGLSTLLSERFQATGDITNLNRAITGNKESLRWIADIDRSLVLEELGEVLQRRSRATNCLKDLREAVDVKRECVHCLANGYYDQGFYWNDLSTALQELFEWTNSLADVEEAIFVSREAVSLAYESHDRASYLDNLGCALRQKALLTGAVADFDEAVKESANAVNASTSDNEDHALFLYDYGHALLSRFDRLPTLDDIDLAIGSLEKAAANPENIHHASFLSLLGYAFHQKYFRVGSTGDLDRAIRISEDAVRYTRASHCSSRIDNLRTLTDTLLSRYKRLGDITDLERVAEISQAVIGGNRLDNAQRAAWLYTLGRVLLERFETRSVIDDVNQAVDLITEAVDLTKERFMRIKYLNYLGTALHRRFATFGSMNDLDKVCKLRFEVVDATPEDDPAIQGHLVNLSNALEARYWQTGSTTDLNNAINLGQRAADSTDTKHPERAMCLHSLGRCLHSRSEQTGSMDDLNNAILAKQAAVQTVAADHPLRAMYLGALGISLQHRSSLTKSIRDIDDAVAMNMDSVKGTPKYDLGRAARLANLGRALRQRFGLTASACDLNEALSRLKEAADSTPPSDIRFHRSISDLALCYMDRFKSLTGTTQSRDDFDEAIRLYQEAIKTVPKDHPDRAACLLNYVMALKDGPGLEPSHIEGNNNVQALAAAEEAAEEISAPVRVRISAAIHAINLLEQNPANIERTTRFFRMAVNLLREISPRSLTRGDQQRTIAEYSGLASGAAASVLDHNEDVGEAIQLLEIGRGVLAGLQLDTRTDITDLELAHSKLAHEFRVLQDELDFEFELDYVVEWNEVASKVTAQATRRNTAAHRMSSLVKEIRSLESFERFLLGPSDDDLLRLASHGSVVALNVAFSRSDALIITPAGLKHLMLPKLLYKDVEANAGILVDALENDNGKVTNLTISKILIWLWDSVAEPILNELGYTESPQIPNDWPHIWWVPTGLLTKFPIHAAGNHSIAGQSVIDRVVSSYTPTLRALEYARQRMQQHSTASVPQSVLLASMPTTPNKTALPFARNEVQLIQSLLPCSIERVDLSNPNKSDILRSLPKFAVAHFACHGEAQANPSESRILLSDWERSPLSVADVTQLKLDTPELAYISTCHAANSRWPIGCTTSVIRLTSRSKRDSQLNAAARETIKSGNDADVMGSIHSRWGMNLFTRRRVMQKKGQDLFRR